MKKKLSFLFAALLCAVMSFATNYVKVTSAPEDWSGEYILVYEKSNTEAYVWTGVDAASCYTAATIANNKVSGDNFVTLTIAPMTGGYSIKINGGGMNGQYVGYKSNQNGMNIQATEILNTISYESNAITIKSGTGSSTMRFNNTNSDTSLRFRYYKSGQQPVQLYKVEVVIPAQGISLDKKTLSLDNGASEQLIATLNPTNATTNIEWSSNNTEVATVSNGLVTAVGVGRATITATVTPQEGVSYSDTCTVTVVAAPDAPTFTVTDEVFEGSMNVALAAAEGMKIYYTTNGDVPTVTSTEYTAPFEITATTTVKAIAYDAANTKASAVAEKTYTKAMTCAEINTATKGTVVNLNTVTVVYVNNANIYVADATGTTLVFAYNFGLQAGDIVKGLKGTIDIYNGLPELKPSVTKDDTTITKGGLQIQPTVLAAVPTAAQVNQYVKFQRVKFDQDYTNYSTKTSANITIGGETFPVRNNFELDFGDIKKDYAYDVIGFVHINNSTIQILPIAINDITMHGAYTVGATNCDYASLYNAFQDYNTKAANGMVAGDVTLQIASDLAEAKNVGIQNPTEYTLTITVDKAEARTITFSQSFDNSGPSGNICIGCDNTLSHACASVATKNIIIDGAYNGSEESYLTIKAIKGCHKGNGPVLIYGNVQDVTVKNCSLIAENGGGSSLFPLNIRTQNETANAPVNITVENNYMYAIAGSADQGIQLTKGTGSKAGLTTPKNITIKDNTIIGRTRGIFIYGADGTTTITGNEIQVLQTADMLSYGIWGCANTSGEFIVENNMLTALKTGGVTASISGITGISAGAGKWYIRNNYVSGFNVASETATGITLIGIEGSSAADTLVIEHNTVALADQTYAIASPNLNKVCMIKPVSTKASVKNNLVYSAEADFNNALVVPAGTMESNVYCTASYVGATEETKAFADYKTAIEPSAKSVESVVFANLAQGDLDLTGTSDGDVNLGVDAIESVALDIYGTTRAAYTYAGAFEGTALTKPDPGTGLDNTEEVAGVQKVLRDGQVYIIRDGKTYNIMGQVVE